MGRFGVVIASLGAIVHPHGGHPQSLCRTQVLRHVLDHAGTGRIDSEARAQQFIAVGLGLGAKLGGVNVVQMLELVADADRLQHSPGIRRIAVGEDELAPRQPPQPRRQPRVRTDPVERNVVHVVQEMVGIDPMFISPASVVP